MSVSALFSDVASALVAVSVLGLVSALVAISVQSLWVGFDFCHRFRFGYGFRFGDGLPNKHHTDQDTSITQADSENMPSKQRSQA